jgi:hypothetical protein
MGRTFLAGVVIVFGAGFLVTSDGTLAKGAALTGKPSGLFVRHAVPFRSAVARRSVFLPPIAPPFNIFNPAATPRRYSYPVSGYRRAFGRDLPAAGVGVYYGSYGVGEEPFFVPVVPASQSAVRSNSRPSDDWRDCSSQQVAVPSESGGERRVTIHRC